MASSALKTAAICAVLVILLSTVGQTAMAAYDVGQQCPSPVTTCRTDCSAACNIVAQRMCNLLCGLTPELLGGVDQTCVNQFFTPCQAVCKNLCEPLPLPGNP